MPPNLIHRLSDTLANQIAAGEVVERPANAVKELVENALDAGARRISIALEDGGRKRIEITDDGQGMSREDALLAVERHTTSKLRSAEDLFDIRTFGFRGEALPSIASVSKFELVTRRASDLSATRLVIEGGRQLEVADAGAPQGTRIVVADLFFNVPARLKFLKTRATELGHVTDWVTRLALANPSVSFSLSEGGRNVLKAEPTTDLRERISALLGRDLFEALYPVAWPPGEASSVGSLDSVKGEAAGSLDAVKVVGFAAGPQRQNQTTREIHTFVNKRYVRDRQLLFAVSRAYDGVLQIGRSPSVVLFLEVPPGQVDVNAHPQKLEVRFENARHVTDAVVKALSTMLSGSPWLAEASRQAPGRTYVLGGRPPPGASAATSPASAPTVPTEVVRPVGDVPLTPQQQRLAGLLAEAQRTHGASWKDEEAVTSTGDASGSLPGPKPLPLPLPASNTTIATLFPMPSTERVGRRTDALIRFSELRYLGQVERTYLVFEGPDGLVLLDQHAAHERVLYEKFRVERAGVAKRGQPLLVPVTLDLPPSDARLVEAALEPLADLGFELEPFGGTTFALKSCPPELEGSDLAATVKELAAEVRDIGRAVAADRLEESLLARMSCHAAVRKGDPMQPEEVRALLEQLDGTPFHAQCPHGRPVAVRFDSASLLQMFERTYEGTSRASARDRLVR